MGSNVLKHEKEFINNKAENADIIVIPGGNFSMWDTVLNLIRSYLNTYHAIYLSDHQVLMEITLIGAHFYLNIKTE